MRNELGFTGVLVTDDIEIGATVSSMPMAEDALRGVFQASLDKRILFIIDDYPSFVDTAPQVPLVLRDLMETYRDNGNVFVLLTGTHVDQLKGRILGESSLITTYIHSYFKVNPLTLDDVRTLGWDYTDEDLAKLYHVTGGMSGNLVHIDPALSVDENIVRLFFKPQGLLCMEPQRLLMRYADYHFVNTMFQFWYQFVFPNFEEINCGQGQHIYDVVVKPVLAEIV